MHLPNKRSHKVINNGARIWQRAFEAAARAKLERDIALLITEVNQLDDSDSHVTDTMDDPRHQVHLN
jgi:hypothetical protein